MSSLHPNVITLIGAADTLSQIHCHFRLNISTRCSEFHVVNNPVRDIYVLWCGVRQVRFKKQVSNSISHLSDVHE